MIISLLLHIYQPPTQHSFVLKEIANTCYSPLLKLLKSKKNIQLTFNIPLSLLEWLEKENLTNSIPSLL